jgi:hypothetical protein
VTSDTPASATLSWTRRRIAAVAELLPARTVGRLAAL